MPGAFDRRTLVTGSGRGVGLAYAQELACTRATRQQLGVWADRFALSQQPVGQQFPEPPATATAE